MIASMVEIYGTVPVVEIDNFIEEKSSTSSSCESGTNELTAVGENCVARGARKQTRPSNMV